MAVANINNIVDSTQVTWRAVGQQRHQDFSSLLQSLQNSDLAGARQALSALQQLPGGSAFQVPTAGAGATGAAATGVGGVGADWSALSQALQSNDMTGAQSAFSQLTHDLQAAAAQRPEVARAAAIQAAIDGTAAAASPTGAAGNARNTVQNDLSALASALQSGSLSSAQNALTQLEQDLQASGLGHRRHHHHGGGMSNVATGYQAQSATAAATDTAATAAAAPTISVTA